VEKSPEDVLNAKDALPEGAYVQAAVTLVQYCVPGSDNEAERGPFLAWWHDTENGVWLHLGMLEAVTNDIRADLRKRAASHGD
jgi:hypothetical protein